MPVAQDEPLLSEEELNVLLGEAAAERQLRLPERAGSTAEDTEVEELRDAIRQLHVRIEFLENLFREHLQSCGTQERERRRAAPATPQNAPQEMLPEVFPPRSERRKRRKPAGGKR